MTSRVFKASALYFGLVFALGFVLGTVRTLVLEAAPDFGRLQAVLIEVPVMLAASWCACDYVVRKLSVPATTPARIGMGGGAFLLLALAEFALAVGLAGLTPGEHFRSYGDTSHAIGLLAQIAFGLFPFIQLTRR
jgi:hypothetical protein